MPRCTAPSRFIRSPTPTSVRRSTVPCSSTPARTVDSISARLRDSRTIDSIPRRWRRWESSRPAGPAPTMPTWVRMRPSRPPGGPVVHRNRRGQQAGSQTSTSTRQDFRAAPTEATPASLRGRDDDATLPEPAPRRTRAVATARGALPFPGCALDPGDRHPLQHRLPALLHLLRAEGRPDPDDVRGGGRADPGGGTDPGDAPGLLHGR